MKGPSRRDLRRVVAALLFVNVLAVVGCAGYPAAHIAWAWWTDVDDRRPLDAYTIVDASGLEPLTSAEVHVVPREEPEGFIREILERAHPARPVLIGGARTTSGGHLHADDALFFDLRQVDTVALEGDLALVGGGARWSAVLRELATAGRVPRVVPGMADATVGGSIATDAWGHRGPSVAAGVRWVDVVRPSGELERCERSAPCFGAIAGGWGLTGVITRAAIEHEADGRVRFERTAYPTDQLEAALETARQDPDVLRLHGMVSLEDRTWFEESVLSTWRREPGPTPAFTTPLWTGPSRTLLRGSVGSPYRRGLRWRLERGLVSSVAVPSSIATAYNVPLSARTNTRVGQTDTRVSLTIRQGALGEALAALGTALRTAPVRPIDVEIYPWEATRGVLLSRGPTGWIVVITFAHPSEALPDVRSTADLLHGIAIPLGSFGLEAWPPARPEHRDAAYPGLPAFREVKDRVDPESRFRSSFWENMTSSRESP